MIAVRIYCCFYLFSVVNLDPAAEKFVYDAMLDVRELVELDDVMDAEELHYGPNGGLIFCMEYLLQPDGMDWLKVVTTSNDLLYQGCIPNYFNLILFIGVKLN